MNKNALMKGIIIPDIGHKLNRFKPRSLWGEIKFR